MRVNKILFIGNLGYIPNLLAVKDFIINITNINEIQTDILYWLCNFVMRKRKR